MLNNLRLFLIAGWLGAAIFFSSVVAPGAFYVLRTFGLANQSEVAGALVSHTLHVINLIGLIVSVSVIVLTLALKNTLARRRFSLQIILMMILGIATTIGEWVIGARMRELRAGFRGPIDQVPADDAGRIAFAALHGYSVVALSVAMIAALIAFLVISKRALPERE